MSDIYGMVSDILCIYVWTMIYVIFLYGSILLILSICKKLYISYTIDHLGSSILLILNSMAPQIKQETVMCHDIAKYAVCKSEESPFASLPAEVTPQATGPPSSPLMTPLMRSPSSASLDMSTNSQSTNEQSQQSTNELKYPPPGSLATTDKALYNRINYKLKNAAMPGVVQGQ